ncbi:MAG: hypothetical protein ACK5MA_01140, partial [Parachlamydiaceae bacterium]
EEFQTEVDEITKKKFQDNFSFKREDFPVLTRVAFHYKAIGNRELADLIDNRREELDKEYKTRDILIGRLESHLNNLKSPQGDLQQQIEEMPAGPAKEEVLAKFQVYQEKKAVYEQFRKAIDETREATSFEAIDNIQSVAEEYAGRLNSAKVEAKRKLFQKAFDEKELNFRTLIRQHAPEANFERLFSDETSQILEASEYKFQMATLKDVYEDLKSVRKCFTDPTHILLLRTRECESYPELRDRIRLLHNQFENPKETELARLTEGEKQCYLERVYLNAAKLGSSSPQDIPLELLDLSVKVHTFPGNVTLNAFTEPAFQARLQKLWNGPFTKASNEDLHVIRVAAQQLNSYPRIQQSLQLILKMQELEFHPSQRCAISGHYLTNGVKVEGQLMDRVAAQIRFADKEIEEVPEHIQLVKAWIDLKRAPRTFFDKLFYSIFKAQRKSEIEKKHYEKFFDAAKENKEIIEQSNNAPEEIKEEALQLNYTLSAMMHLVDTLNPINEATAAQDAWLIPQIRLFVLNFEQDIGKVLCDEMSRHLLDMESLLDSYTTNGELNPILLDTMEIYSEIVKKIFGSALVHNWVKVKISVPHWKKAVQEYDVEVKKEVKARKLLIDLRCILSRI